MDLFFFLLILILNRRKCPNTPAEATDGTIIKMVFIKEESEDMKIEETFRVKHEDTETQTKMVFIKEESEDMKIEEAFRVKHEDTETQTKMCLLKRRVKV